MIRAVWAGEHQFAPVFVCFALVAALGSSLAFWASFFVLCSIECSALPWMTFVICPAVTLFIVLPVCIWLGVGSFRSANRLRAPLRTAARITVATSFVWAPAASGVLFALILGGMQRWN
jgi:hypothetical protein